jgi:hypothetical protein
MTEPPERPEPEMTTAAGPWGGPVDIASAWAAQVRDVRFMRIKESAVRSSFTQSVIVELLGYTPVHPSDQFTMAEEEPLGRGSVDRALGRFSPDRREIIAPFELKGPKTRDLDAIMPGRAKSPVQQAWEYAIDAMAAGLADRLWNVRYIVALLEAAETLERPQKRGPYKPRQPKAA